MRAELDGTEGPAADDETPASEPTVDDVGGLSLALLGRLQSRVDATADERKARVSQLESLGGEADKLRAMLGYPATSGTPTDISRAAGHEYK